MTTYYLVQGDDAPQIRVTLTRESSGDVIDLSDADVSLKFRKKGSNTVLFTLTSVATAENKSQGIAVFSWDSDSLDIPAGNYEGEVEIYFTSQAVTETVYELLDFVVREDF